MEENNNMRKNSNKKAYYEFYTQDGEKVEIRLVKWLNSISQRPGNNGSIQKEPRKRHSATPNRQLDCYDVTITINGESQTKRCYLDSISPSIEFNDPTKDKRLEEVLESVFSPQKIEESEQEANEYDSTYLYLGIIDQDNDGNWHTERVSSDQINILKTIYEKIRADEKMELAYIADSRGVKLNETFSDEEILRALYRLKAMVDTDLKHEIALGNKSSEERIENLQKRRDQLQEEILEHEHMPEEIWENEYMPEEIRRIILETSEEANRIGKIIKSVRNNSIDGCILKEYGQDSIAIEEFIATYHEYELSKRLGVPFDIGQDRDFVGDASGNYVFLIESHFEELDPNNPEVVRKQEEMSLLRKRMTEQPAEFAIPGQLIIGGHVIPMTKEELINAGLDPEEFGWKSLEQVKLEEMMKNATVTANDIASATMGLPRRVVDSASIFFENGSKAKDQRGE